MPGFLYQSKDGISNFEVRKKWLFDTNVKHAGLHLNGNDLYIFYSQVGDQSEQIFYSKMDWTSTNWKDWKVEPARALLQPELEWEGANLPKEKSMRGEVGTPVNQLRDPDVFEDKNGELYLLYTGAGEQGIRMAKLKLD